MPEWLKKKLKKGGVDNPYALMNAAGIMRGSKTVIHGEGEQREAMSRFAKARAQKKAMRKVAGRGGR